MLIKHSQPSPADEDGADIPPFSKTRTFPPLINGRHNGHQPPQTVDFIAGKTDKPESYSKRISSCYRYTLNIRRTKKRRYQPHTRQAQKSSHQSVITNRSPIHSTSLIESAGCKISPQVGGETPPHLHIKIIPYPT